MKFTLEHAIILILAVALIYYMIKHRNLLTDIVSIPDRDHPELKEVKAQHYKYRRPVVGCDLWRAGHQCSTNIGPNGIKYSAPIYGYCSDVNSPEKGRCIAYPYDLITGKKMDRSSGCEMVAEACHKSESAEVNFKLYVKKKYM